MGLKEQILGATSDAEVERFEIPEWEPEGSEPIYMRVIGGDRRDELEIALDQPVSSPLRQNMRAKIASWCLCDASGKLIFANADVKALGERSGTVLDRVVLRAQVKSALTKESVGELAGNSDAARSGDSGSS